MKNYREAIIRAIERDGWQFARASGAHRHYRHPTKPGIVTVAHHGMSAHVPPGTLNSILKQAGLK
uniref:YcfA family protein n=1 Tax=mine drainage metagenome TaxID=410659 RepID=E6Q6J4_9ZZZZ